MSNNRPSFKEVFIKGSIVYNPVLIQLVGLCPVIAASTTVASAALLSAVLCFDLLVTCVVASAFLKEIPRWIRVALYLVIGTVITCPILYIIEEHTLWNISLGMSIYLPLIAVNSVTAVHCEQFSVKNSVRLAAYDAVAVGFGVSVIFLIVGAVREIIGNSSFAGVSLNLPISFKGMALPFGCLIMLGLLAAMLKAAVAKFSPEDNETEEEIKEDVAAEPVIDAVAEPEVAPEEEPEQEDDGEAPEAVANAAAFDEIDEFFKNLESEISFEGEGDDR